jgi:hypothetical protein
LLHAYAGFWLGLFFNREDGDDIRPKRRLTVNGLQAVISQVIDICIIFIVILCESEHGL